MAGMPRIYFGIWFDKSVLELAKSFEQRRLDYQSTILTHLRTCSTSIYHLRSHEGSAELTVLQSTPLHLTVTILPTACPLPFLCLFPFSRLVALRHLSSYIQPVSIRPYLNILWAEVPIHMHLQVQFLRSILRSHYFQAVLICMEELVL